MTSPAAFTMEAHYVVSPPQPVPSYLVARKEWERLKVRIGALHGEPLFHQTLGSALIGVALTTAVTIFLGLPASANPGTTKVIAWAIVIVSAAIGVNCLNMAGTKRKMHRVTAGDIVDEMKVIQDRFDAASATSSQK